MELDTRIKSIDDIQTILHYDVNCIGCKGYFFDEFIQTKDLSKCRYGELIDITTHDDRNDLCFKAEYEEGLVGFYRFFLPETDLKPIKKKYRPLTNTEFVDLFDSGKLRSIRLKDASTERLERLIITDIYVQGDYLYAKLNSSDTGYGPAYFFSKCEYFDGKDWQPFGIEVEEE